MNLEQFIEFIKPLINEPSEKANLVDFDLTLTTCNTLSGSGQNLGPEKNLRNGIPKEFLTQPLAIVTDNFNLELVIQYLWKLRGLEPSNDVATATLECTDRMSIHAIKMGANGPLVLIAYNPHRVQLATAKNSRIELLIEIMQRSGMISQNANLGFYDDNKTILDATHDSEKLSSLIKKGALSLHHVNPQGIPQIPFFVSIALKSSGTGLDIHSIFSSLNMAVKAATATSSAVEEGSVSHSPCQH